MGCDAMDGMGCVWVACGTRNGAGKNAHRGSYGVTHFTLAFNCAWMVACESLPR